MTNTPQDVVSPAHDRPADDIQLTEAMIEEGISALLNSGVIQEQAAPRTAVVAILKAALQAAAREAA